MAVVIVIVTAMRVIILPAMTIMVVIAFVILNPTVNVFFIFIAIGLFQPVSSISVTPSVNVVPYVVLNVLKISLCKKPCCS